MSKRLKTDTFNPRKLLKQVRNSTVLRKNIDCVVIVGIVAILATISCFFIYGSRLNNPPIRSDGFSYYAYLPTVLIDHDLSFNLAKHNTYAGGKLSDYSIGKYPQTGKMLTIVPPGTAVLEVPFFIVADLYTQVTGGVRTGYSQPYQAAIVISGIFYLCAGSLLLYLTLRRQFGKRVAFVSVLTVVFATNVFHYGTYDNSFSHVYSFAAVAALLYMLFRVYDPKGKAQQRRSVWLVAIGACVGLITLIRVPNVIVGLLLIPIVFKGKRTSKDYIKDILLVGIPFVVVLSPYILYLIYSTGSLSTNPYAVFPLNPKLYPGYHLTQGKYGGFTNLNRPEFINFLFSPRKGLFFWAPVLAPAFVSLIALVKKWRGIGWAVVGVLCIQIYLCSSWWAWAFGGSFGSRPFVDTMPLLGLALAAGIAYVRRLKIIGVITALLVFINIVYMYGYWKGYVSNDNMTLKAVIQVPHFILKDAHIVQ